MKNPFAIRRDEIKVTQRKIAETVGVLPQSVNAWENENRERGYLPQPHMYDKVAEAYQKSRAWVVQSVMELDGANLETASK